MKKLIIFILLLNTLALFAGDWNTAVGGNCARNSLTDEFGPLTNELIWSGGNLSQASSQAIIEGDYLIVHRRENIGDLFHGTPIIAYELQTGVEIWRTELPVVNPDTEFYNRVSGVLNGQVYATRSAGYFNAGPLYALDIETGDIIWVSEDEVTETVVESVAFAENGDIIAGNLNNILRIDHEDGTTVWQIARYAPSSDGASISVYENKGYSWEVGTNGPKVSVYDLDSGQHLYSSESISPGYVQQTGLLVGPDGTIYAPRTHNNPNDDYFVAFEDTGTEFIEKWRVEYGYAVGASHGVGPDGSVYTYTRDFEVMRIEPDTGEILNLSQPIAGQVTAIWPRMAVGADGVIYVTNDNMLFSFNPDLSLRWSESIIGIGTGGPAIGDDGTMVICANGTNIRAYLGQGTFTGIVCGTVTDEITLNPIENALITIGSYQTTTDTNGDYSIEVDPGTYQLTCEHDDYQFYTHPDDVIVIADETTIVNFGMEPLVNVDDDLISSVIKLIGNYPNPFNPSTTISFSLTAEYTENLELSIYNMKGQKVKVFDVFPNGGLGTREVIWNGTDKNNQPVSSGIYFYKLKAGSFEQTKKMILLK